MSISGLSLFNPQLNVATNYQQQLQQQLQQIGQALQSGNLSAAQSDFATLQQSFSQTTPTTASASSTSSDSVHQAFNQLASDLQSGNLSAAQKDLSIVQQDVKGYAGPPSTHFYPHGGPVRQGPTTQGATDNPLTQNLNPISQNLATSTPAGAQQAYAALQQELQQFALGSEDSEELSNPLSLVA